MRSEFVRGLDTLTEYFLDEQGNRIGERSRPLGSNVDIRDVDIIWYEGVPTAETTEEYSSRYLNSDRRSSKKAFSTKLTKEMVERVQSKGLKDDFSLILENHYNITNVTSVLADESISDEAKELIFFGEASTEEEEEEEKEILLVDKWGKTFVYEEGMSYKANGISGSLYILHCNTPVIFFEGEYGVEYEVTDLKLHI